jgi:processive 1,2-diacylglycerol beta-glucosyltransferase
MVKVFNKVTGEFIGRISEAELDFLAQQLEEESIKDTDYYIREETLLQFEKDGAPGHLLEVLRGGMRSDNAIEIRWERDKSAP